LNVMAEEDKPEQVVQEGEKKRRRGGKGRGEKKEKEGGDAKPEKKEKGKGKGGDAKPKGKGKGKGAADAGKGGGSRSQKNQQKQENAQMAAALLTALQCPQAVKPETGGKKKRGKGGDAGKKLLDIVTGAAPVPAGFELGPSLPSKGKGKGKGKGKDGKDGKGKKGDKGKGKGAKGWKGGESSMTDVTDMIEQACSEDQPMPTVLAAGDFDYRSKRFLHELIMRTDRAHEENPSLETGMARLQRALDLCVEVARTKERDDVDNWRAYVSKLLRKEDPELYDELKERDIRRRQSPAAD